MELIAHRGVSARAPENTEPAFRLALEARADGIETDVRLTADGHLVLMHDDDMTRTTDATGCISESTLEEVRAADAGARFGWHERLTPPTLHEFLALAAGRTHLYLEVKGALCRGEYRSAAPVARAVLDPIEGLASVTVSSFDPGAIELVRTAAPQLRTGLAILPGAGLDWALALIETAGHDELHVARSVVDVGLVEEAHARGRRVLVWTVNEPEDLRAMVAMGVDGVFTDDVAAARAALADHA